MADDSISDDPTVEFAKDILPSIPLLMYGSGDVAPDEVDPSSAELVAILTAQYVSKLIRAAVDAHDIFTNGAGGKLPPKPFKKRKRVHVVERNSMSHKALYEGDWDLPLPIPKIKNSRREKIDEKSDSINSLTDASHNQTEQIVKGLEIYPDRIRNMYVTTTHAIGAQSFIFPCFHDEELYNKVQEMKFFQNKIETTLLDSSMLDFVREEEERFEHLSQSMFSWMDAEGESIALEQKKKENARRFAIRTGLDIHFPGVEELMLQPYGSHE